VAIALTAGYGQMQEALEGRRYETYMSFMYRTKGFWEPVNESINKEHQCTLYTLLGESDSNSGHTCKIMQNTHLTY